MLDKELEELREAVIAAEEELENSDYDKIDFNLARYIKMKERFNRLSRRLKS